MARPVMADPYFERGEVPGYTVEGEADTTGYTIRNPAADAGLPERYGEEVGPVAGGILGEPGACSTTAGLGMESLKGIFSGPQHAMTPAPLELGDGGTGE